MLRIDTRPTACSTAVSLVVAALLGLGVVMVFSAGASLTSPTITDDIAKNPAVRQGMFSFAALLCALTVGMVPYRFWRMREKAAFQPAVLLVLVTVVLLSLVLVPGVGEVRNGARRWISIGGIGFQPSEVAKFAVVVFMASACARMGVRLRHFWTGLVPIIAIVGVMAGLVGIEDFGTGALLIGVTGGLLLASKARLRHLLVLAVPALAAAVFFVSSRSYRLERLMTFMDPYADPQGAGYHQIQSLITIASGGWWGRGLGGGIQKYGYLPEGRSDFIFAVICEELGVIGGAGVIGLFILLLWHGRKAVGHAPDELGKLLALGATLTVGIQAAMNIAVVTVSVPTKGIALPMVSAGGTGVVIFSCLLGLLINVARHVRWQGSPQTAYQDVESPEEAPGIPARGLVAPT